MAKRELPKLSYSADLTGDLPRGLRRQYDEYLAAQAMASNKAEAFKVALANHVASQVPAGKAVGVFLTFGKVQIAFVDPTDPRRVGARGQVGRSGPQIKL